ncbi:MAG TPA: hypothetical protein VHE80_01415 [Acidimicrobiales bacterium]|nr:hypothetical protein [Acidimicrobiales bacterium]
MHERVEFGLSRRQLDYHLRWMLRRCPKEPEKLPEFLGEVMVTLIEKNNAALARRAAEDDRPDLPEGG